MIRKLFGALGLVGLHKAAELGKDMEVSGQSYVSRPPMRYGRCNRKKKTNFLALRHKAKLKRRRKGL